MTAGLTDQNLLWQMGAHLKAIDILMPLASSNFLNLALKQYMQYIFSLIQINYSSCSHYSTPEKSDLKF